ncbi:hypothetical protein [Paracoccus albus]|uniref:hypothetical protein n=1 Tax=Paracoccus albus TaxID=3017784 RepID=UPI0022F0E61D|nr:hypothetical protein [Paracoccus albus]WBU58972.1 hypothetical protein PAF20_09110 [Paracoccus albus]
MPPKAEPLGGYDLGPLVLVVIGLVVVGLVLAVCLAGFMAGLAKDGKWVSLLLCGLIVAVPLAAVLWAETLRLSLAQ